MTKTLQHESILLLEPDLEQLSGFVKNLNTEFFSARSSSGQKVSFDLRAVRAELRRLVQAWRNSGPNVSRLLEADPVLKKASWNFQAQLIPTETGSARLTYLTVPRNLGPSDPLGLALSHFLGFLLNPFNDRLGGPCANCEKYYVKKTNRQKAIYCSEKCGHQVTSRLANRERRKSEHRKQLVIAKDWIARWQHTKTSLPWKDWVSGRANVKKHWLTRAVRSEELIEPVKQGRGRAPRETE
jgi:hypothetical protein